MDRPYLIPFRPSWITRARRPHTNLCISVKKTIQPTKMACTGSYTPTKEIEKIEEQLFKCRAELRRFSCYRENIEMMRHSFRVTDKTEKIRIGDKAKWTFSSERSFPWAEEEVKSATYLCLVSGSQIIVPNQLLPIYRASMNENSRWVKKKRETLFQILIQER